LGTTTIDYSPVAQRNADETPVGENIVLCHYLYPASLWCLAYHDLCLPISSPKRKLATLVLTYLGRVRE
ncbi:hypothetical protein HAX54_022909, partial [Datura stramonium]|nr:hypothetical protein [Datura stramonium]